MRRIWTGLPLPLLLFLAGCGGAPVPIPTTAEPDFTFLVVADTHYGQSMWDDNEAANKATIDSMNALPGTPWPPEANGGTVSAPLAAVVVGDMTDTGEYFNWNGYWLLRRHDGFREDYGARGEGRLTYPVLEGYGNHDLTRGRTVVLEGIKARNALRAGIRLSPDGLHASWDWGGVHFAHLNLYPGGPGGAHDSLAFLKADLAAQVGASRRPVILIHHYGFDPFSCEARWWTDTEREAYYAAIKDYNVVAIFNGHLHSQQHMQWHGIDAFTAGRAGDGCFLLVRVTADQLVVAGHTRQGWGACWKKAVDR